MIKVTYIYSACVLIETQDCKVLADPWFTQGINSGAWYHYPYDPELIHKVPEVDYIYISHIHTDHYDPTALKQLTNKYPKAKIIIADFSTNYLATVMRIAGFDFKIVNQLKVGDTEIGLFPNELDESDVDSALVIKHNGSAVINMNDNFFHQKQIDSILSFCQNASIDIALLPYTGAGPYPQTYFDQEKDLDRLIEKAEIKKQQFFERYTTMRDALGAKVNIPFAGKYILGGPLAFMNHYRGNPDPITVTEWDPSAIVLDDGGSAWIDTETLTPHGQRTEPYNLDALNDRIQEVSQLPMTYDIELASLPVERIPFKALLPSAYHRAHPKSRVDHDYWFAIQLPDTSYYLINLNKNKFEQKFVENPLEFTPRSEVYVNPRHLFGLLTRLYHWNNAHGGSHLQCRRFPDEYCREAEAFFHFFHV